jgi:hypothetical protein
MDKFLRFDRFLPKLSNAVKCRRFGFAEMSPRSVTNVCGDAVLFNLSHLKATRIFAKLDPRHFLVANRCDQSRFHLRFVFSDAIVLAGAGLLDL